MNQISIELWKDVVGYEGKYQVSSEGRVKSLQRKVPCGQNGKGLRVVQERILKPACSKRDLHLYVVLGKGKPGSTVHSLVASAFIGPRPKNMEVRHLNGNPQDNRIENLKYGTRSENILDVFSTGRAWRKLTASQVTQIRDALNDGVRGISLAKRFNVSQTTISRIKKGVSFKWLM